jgi:predicted nucleic acid-binding protein
MYLVDTDVISEMRRGRSANAGVRAFFASAVAEAADLYLSVITLGELRRGVELIRYRGDGAQARRLERWLVQVTAQHGDALLPVDEEVAQVWGRLRVPHPENPLDKLIAATALIYDLTLVTRNTRHFAMTRVRLLDPFS